MPITDFKNFDYNRSLNQSTVLENYNLYSTDFVLQEAVKNNGGGWIEDQAISFGEILGSERVQRMANLANQNIPILKTHDRFGNRLDSVEFHEGYHELMRIGMSFGIHHLSWTTKKEGGYVARSALAYLKQQVDEGTSCPLTMTFASVPSLKLNTDLAKVWLPRLFSNEYDERFIAADQKKGITIGMGMTEPQGGSDVRTNTTVAYSIGHGEYIINGRKWFCSAPMSDAFLILAQTEKGISCFLLPRFLPDGTKNNIKIQRLKDKLGNKSNASSEVEFHNCWAQIIGEEGRGIANIMNMVQHTRLDCTVGSAATLHKAICEAIHHVSSRQAFGKNLIDQPLMKNVLMDLCLESEALTALAFRVARSFDESKNSETTASFKRLITAIGKFWNTKRAIYGVTEAMECLGGNGYVEESILPRLYRDVPVNSIWEGSGNVQCLDVLKMIKREPEVIEILFKELSLSEGLNKFYDQHIQIIKKEYFQNGIPEEFYARKLVSDLALALQANELLLHAPEFISELFCESRIKDNTTQYVFGTLPKHTESDKIIERNFLLSSVLI